MFLCVLKGSALPQPFSPTHPNAPHRGQHWPSRQKSPSHNHQNRFRSTNAMGRACLGWPHWLPRQRGRSELWAVLEEAGHAPTPRLVQTCLDGQRLEWMGRRPIHVVSHCIWRSYVICCCHRAVWVPSLWCIKRGVFSSMWISWICGSCEGHLLRPREFAHKFLPKRPNRAESIMLLVQALYEHCLRSSGLPEHEE